MRIGILGHYGNQNLGDEAIIEAAIDSVRRHFPEADISCFSIDPNDTRIRHGVPAYPIRYIETRSDNTPAGSDEDKSPEKRPDPDIHKASHKRNHRSPVAYLKKLAFFRFCIGVLRTMVSGISNLRLEIPFLFKNYKLLTSYDLLLVTGSNQFLDNFGGVWGFPYTLLKWITIAKLSGTKVALISLGAGPLEATVSKVFSKLSVYLSDFVSYRDEPSRELVEGKKKSYSSFVFPDIASNLKIKKDLPYPPESEHVVIGINPMPVYDKRYWCDPDDRKYAEYIEKLAATIERLNQSNYEIFLFNTQKMDNVVIDDILGQIDEGTNSRITRKTATTTQELLDIIRSAHICVATRFHGTVLSLLSGVPVVGICYHRKIGDLLTNMNQGNYQVNIDEFTSNSLYSIIQKLEQVLEHEHDVILRGSRKQRELTESQYTRLAELFTPKPATI